MAVNLKCAEKVFYNICYITDIILQINIREISERYQRDNREITERYQRDIREISERY